MISFALALLVTVVAPPSPGPAPSAGSEARAFWAEVRLTGPLESVRFDCGADGEVVLALGLVVGEERVVLLPFPVRSPLGQAGLATVPAPRVEITGKGAFGAGVGTAEFLGWVDPQPGAALANLQAGLFGRPRPPVEGAGVRANVAETLLLGASLLLVVAARRRRALALWIGLLGGGLLLVLAGRRVPETRTVVVEEVDLALGQAFVVRAGSRSLEVPLGERPDRIEVLPRDGALRFELVLDGDRIAAHLVALSPGTRLYDLRAHGFGTWSRSRNSGPALAETWVRGSQGRWTAHGAWPAGSPLPASVGGGRPAPGWLSTGLPPGRGVLLGRREEDADSWVRVLGF